MSKFNLDNNHPLIPNSNKYILERKFVSVHSEDRDYLKYPNSADFEIELPQDYINVQTVKLATWCLPVNYDVFSILNANTEMAFFLTDIYNPVEVGNGDPLQYAIYEGLIAKANQSLKVYLIKIENGFYNPEQMANELKNRMNAVVTLYLDNYFSENASLYDPTVIASFQGYNQFQVVYNPVSQKMWFGNKSSGFAIDPNAQINNIRSVEIDSRCVRKNRLPSFAEWGIYPLLGFGRCTAYSSSYLASELPRTFFDELNPGDNGYWLVPDLPGAVVSTIFAPAKINLMGPAYIYMEVDGLNCIDETSPYNISEFTRHTNETNGVVNSSFAKLALNSTPIAQTFDANMIPYKWFNPPAERIRKLKIRLRYHNGAAVEFGNFDWSFLLEFNLLTPQQDRTKNITFFY